MKRAYDESTLQFAYLYRDVVWGTGETIEECLHRANYRLNPSVRKTAIEPQLDYIIRCTERLARAVETLGGDCPHEIIEGYILDCADE